MAEEQQQQQQPNTQNTFSKGMNKDLMDSALPQGTYSHARNCVQNLPDGQMFGLNSESSNVLCTILPYTLIGAIPLANNDWMVFCTDNFNSEIGIFHESLCTYESITKGTQPCLNFNKDNLITGASRRGFDCGYNVYWSDGARNPDRTINTAKVPFIQDCTASTPTCRICVDTDVLDCEKLRLAPYFSIPCLKLSKSSGSGTLLNGSYQLAVRYTINEIPCTDFVALSNVISLFSHTNIAGALILNISGAEVEQFDQMEVVIVSMVNYQIEARKLGVYSTRQTTIQIDDIDQTLQIVPLSLLPLNTPAIEKSDAIYNVGTYLTRVGVYDKADFNYQPLANKIKAKWCVTAFPSDYYHKGGNEFGMEVSYLRREVYAFYIRWIYNSGDKSASYHIPGVVVGPVGSTGRTGTLTIGGPSVPGSLGTLCSGTFAGYESSEIYPDNKPEVWGDLCGRRIRHHKFPDQTMLGPALTHFSATTVNVMGVYFENIQLPVDNTGTIIPDIQGYEILRAVREGHKSVIAKGMVNHTRGYKDPYTGKEGIYQNYPYNDLRPDNFLTSRVETLNVGSPNTRANQNHNDDYPLDKVYSDIVSFHSPDTSFQHPVLGTGDLTIVQQITGVSTGYFQQTYRHPRFKTITNFGSIVAAIISATELFMDIISAIAILTGGNSPQIRLAPTEEVALDIPLFVDNNYTWNIASTDASWLLKTAANVANFALFVAMIPIKFKVIQQQLVVLITGLVPARAFAWQWNSSGLYDTPSVVFGNSYRIKDYQYVEGHLQEFDNKTLNNLWRNNYVAFKLDNGLFIPTPIGVVDTSRKTMFDRSIGPSDNDSLLGPYTEPIVSFYGAYTIPQISQYGQIDSTKQVPISCVFPVDPAAATAFFSTPVLFNGDTYICRYTEKNPFFYFNDWLFSQPDDFEYNYRNYINIPYPRYWIDNTKIYGDFIALASSIRHLDAQQNGGTLPLLMLDTYVKNGAFYISCNGVRDFYCESNVNVGYRDWEDLESKRFYDPYGYQDISMMFRSDIIKSDILYKYDYSLSASQFYNQYISWGQCLRRDYDPALAYTCFAYYPRRVAYSLPQEEELKKDNWRTFLPNNYKDFNANVTAIKEIHKTGALIMLKNESPQQFIGTEVLASSSATEYTVGTGALFNQALASVSNADNALQYGSCQNRMSIINTPHGLFWVSQNTGKVFVYKGGEGLQDISVGLKWHLAHYLPSQLLLQFPEYPLADNPVVGVGVQCIYDNINETVYVCKKDYKALPGVFYIPSTGFLYDDPILMRSIKVQLGDSLYFEDCSWTLSYSCLTKQWVSFHDWKPSFNIPAKTHFLTTSDVADASRSLWRHNVRTDNFCNFYGTDYPMEVEMPINTGFNVTTLQNVEVFAEAYNYKANQTDRFQQYNNFFDRALVSNSEQSTVMLKLALKPWDNPYATLGFPFMDSTGLNILYDKVEQKYRFNQGLYDFSRDRFQFGLGTIQSRITNGNGYTFNLNTPYFDFSKPPLQQKKIRHYKSRLFLRRNIVSFNSISLYLNRTNNQNSPR